MAKSEKSLYRVRFVDHGEKKTVEVVVENVYGSDFMGLVTLEKLVFQGHKKLVILPEEEAVRERFSKTNKLHIPYHCIIYVEEFADDPVNLQQLPFIREVSSAEASSKKTSQFDINRSGDH